MPQRSPQPNVRARGTSLFFPLKFWILVVLTGIAAGLAGALLMLLLHAVQHLAFGYRTGEFLDNVARASFSRRVLVLFLAAVIAIATRRILKLTAAQTRINLSESIWFKSGKLPFLPTLTKALLSIVIVGMGVSLGREGALKQTGAAIADKFAEWFRIPPAQRRLLVACAAGAGMAAAYNVPFGGAIFAVEVLLGTFSLPLMLPALAASFIATGVSFLLLPVKPTYIVPAYSLHLSDAAWACLAGPILGLGAFLWLRAILWADEFKPRGWKIIVTTIVIFTALGAVAIKYPDVLGNGKGVIQKAYLDQLDLSLLVPLFVLKMIAAPACLGTGSPGGLFTPTLTVGALLGGLLGHLWVFAVPTPQMGIFAIVGSAAVLAAATEGPISSVAFLLELTHRAAPIMVPILLAIVGASLVTRALDDRSIYSGRVKRGMQAAEKKTLQGSPFDRLATQEFSVCSSVADYTTVLERLFRQHVPLFVVDNEGKLVGQICDRDLLADHTGLPFPLTTAADLAQPVDPIPSTSPDSEATARLTRHASAIPVIDPNSGKLLGAIANPNPLG